MKKIKEIKRLQEEVNRRHQVEDEAVRLISECKFEEAMRLLETI